MQITVLGSLNIDKVYNLTHFVLPGETIFADGYTSVCGGKGFNLATALAKSGEKIKFAGSIGDDGDIFLEKLEEMNVDTSFIRKSNLPSGHAIIQVTDKGENCIIVVHGANYDISEVYCTKVLDSMKENDMVVLQNEISNVSFIIEEAHKRGIKVAYNPSPMDKSITDRVFALTDILFLNEVEAEEMSGYRDEENTLKQLRKKYPETTIVITLGGRGVICLDSENKIHRCGTYDTKVVDTTAAGDTFTGYFLAGYTHNKDIDSALCYASAAASISVSRSGASISIPADEEVRAFMEKNSIYN